MYRDDDTGDTTTSDYADNGDCKLPADTGKLPDDTDDDASVYESRYR